MNMLELKKSLSGNIVSRYRGAYYEIMYDNYHSKLFDYLNYLQDNENIKNITISKDDIIIEFDICGILIKLVCEYRKPLSLPLYILDMGGGYEYNETKIIMECVKENDVILDIGANVGLYTILFNKYKNCTTYSFEPIKYTFNLLNKNLKINDINAKIYNIGLSNKNKVETFYFNTNEIAASSMRDLREDNSVKIVKCDIEKMDNFIEKEKILNIDFIKIDIEGAELFALQGGIKSINKYKPIIFCEMLRKWAKKFDYHPNDIIELLNKIGYSCYAIKENVLEPISQVTDDMIETNFLFFNKAKARHKKLVDKLVR